MSYELQGVIIKIGNTDKISDKFSKREFIVEKTESNGTNSWIDKVKFQLMNAKCAELDKFTEGEEVNVKFNIKGSEYTKDGKTSYFVNLNAWGIDSVGTQSTPQPVQPPQPTQQSDDLPF